MILLVIIKIYHINYLANILCLFICIYDNRELYMKKYDIIYSIGRDCACAIYLKQNGLRITSGPFDWLTNANFEDRFNLLLNNFEYFLDKKYLKLMPKPSQFPADKNNDYYENTKTHLYFWHDFPADKNLNIVYPEIKKKYDRRIQRFYNNIKNKKRVLLVWFSQVHQTPDKTIVDLCDLFSKKMGKTIDFLIIEHKNGVTLPRSYKLKDNIERWECHALKTDEQGIPQTLGNIDLIQPIFAELQIDIPVIRKITSKLLYLLAKIICLFIPIKKWRKIIKKHLYN